MTLQAQGGEGVLVSAAREIIDLFGVSGCEHEGVLLVVGVAVIRRVCSLWGEVSSG